MYRALSKYCVFPSYEWIARRRFLNKLQFLEESQWWSSQELQEFQANKLKRLLDFAYARNPFYRRRFQEAGIAPNSIKDFQDLKRIPVLTKEDVTHSLQELRSIGFGEKDLRRDKTSGSTGKNLHFYFDRNSWDWRTAAVWRNKGWYNLHFGDPCIVLWGSPIGETFSERLHLQLRNALLRERLISSYRLDHQSLTEAVVRLTRKKPKALIGYVSALDVLAKFIEANQIGDVQIDAIVPAAETLFDYQRDLFERAFHGKVFNRYGCHEFTGIAHECAAHMGMHINAENLFVEVLRDGKSANPEELGEIVITDLENYGMPFIRYQIDDLGALSGELCRCGRGLPLLSSVEGRVYDLVRCPNGAVQTGTFFCKLTRSVSGIDEFQVIQESLEKIRLRLVTNKAFDSSSKLYFTKMIQGSCGAPMEVHFDFVKEIEPLKSGKRRYIVSLIDATPGN